MQVSRELHEPNGRRALHTGSFHNFAQLPRSRQRLGLAYAGKIVRDGHLVGFRDLFTEVLSLHRLVPFDGTMRSVSKRVGNSGLKMIAKFF
jgi:hypothetical protein